MSAKERSLSISSILRSEFGVNVKFVNENMTNLVPSTFVTKILVGNNVGNAKTERFCKRNDEGDKNYPEMSFAFLFSMNPRLSPR